MKELKLPFKSVAVFDIPGVPSGCGLGGVWLMFEGVPTGTSRRDLLSGVGRLADSKHYPLLDSTQTKRKRAARKSRRK